MCRGACTNSRAALCPFGGDRHEGNEAREALVDYTDCSHPLTRASYVAHLGLQLPLDSVETMMLAMEISGGAL